MTSQTDAVAGRLIALLEAVREMRRAEDKHVRTVEREGVERPGRLLNATRDDCDLWLARVFDRATVRDLTAFIKHVEALSAPLPAPQVPDKVGFTGAQLDDAAQSRWQHDSQMLQRTAFRDGAYWAAEVLAAPDKVGDGAARSSGRSEPSLSALQGRDK